MPNQVQKYLDDARHFQKHGEHELAMSSLYMAQQNDRLKEHEIEIQKLFSFSCRKLGNYNMALLHINNALAENAKLEKNVNTQNERAVCLMNKGIIYEQLTNYDKAIKCYLLAVDIFISLYKENPEKNGLIINSLFTLGLLYYEQRYFQKAKEIFEETLNYFGEGKETDRRYISICNVLHELQEG